MNLICAYILSNNHKLTLVYLNYGNVEEGKL